MTTPTDHADHEPLDLAERLMRWMESEGWFDPPSRRCVEPTTAVIVAEVLADDHPGGDRDRP